MKQSVPASFRSWRSSALRSYSETCSSNWTGWHFEMGTPLTAIDLKRLAAEVSVQHGIRIDPDDPMLAVVTLNRLVFEHAVAQVLERMQNSVQDFEAATEKVQ